MPEVAQSYLHSSGQNADCDGRTDGQIERMMLVFIVIYSIRTDLCSRTSDAVIFDVNVVAVVRLITQHRNAASRIDKNSATEGTAALSITSHDSSVVGNRSNTRCSLPRTCLCIGVRIKQSIISDVSWSNNDNSTSWTTEGECLTADGTTPTTTEKRDSCYSCDTYMWYSILFTGTEGPLLLHKLLIKVLSRFIYLNRLHLWNVM